MLGHLFWSSYLDFHEADEEVTSMCSDKSMKPINTSDYTPRRGWQNVFLINPVNIKRFAAVGIFPRTHGVLLSVFSTLPQRKE